MGEEPAIERDHQGPADKNKPAQTQAAQQPRLQRDAEHVPYQRKHPVRKTQPAIDDLAEDGSVSEQYTHDSNVTIRGGGLSGREYRRSRSSMPQLQRSVHYGQYLEVPKGRRAIFTPAGRRRRRNSIIAAVVVAVAFVIVFFIVRALLG